jgi:alkylation response protein AidB-like acyl-CoA dehydrogenase
VQPWQDKELDETRQKYAEFAATELAGDWRERDAAKEFSLERWRKACDAGVLGLSMPEEYGGSAKSYGHSIAAIEGMCESCRDSGFFFAMSSQISGIQLALLSSASAELQSLYLPALIRGDHRACLGFSEETAGSDIYSIETTAEKVDGGYTLNGSKAFTTNSLDSTCSLVFAKTANKRTAFDFTGFMVDLDWDGVSHGEPYDKSTLRTCSMGRLIFKDVFVPDSHIVRGVGRGLEVIKYSIGWERVMLMGVCIGPMSRVLKETIERARDREQFGKPIGSYQQISSKIAEMIVRLRLSRQVVYDLCGRLQEADGEIGKFLEDVAITKLYVTESFKQSMLDATQIWGGRGVCYDWPIQQDMRDSLSSSIWAGTSETLRNTIAKLNGVG